MADRYPSDPGDPMKALEERLRLLEAKVEEQNRRNPLNNGVFSGILRNVDASAITLGEWGPDGFTFYDTAGNVVAILGNDGVAIFDDAAQLRCRIGLISGNDYGIQVFDADGGLRFSILNDGYHDPWLPHPMVVAGANTTITSATFVPVYQGQVELVTHEGVSISAIVNTDVGTTAEFRLRNATTGGNTNAVTVGSGASVAQTFQWLHGASLGSGPVRFDLEARRTGGAGNVYVFQPYTLAMADPDQCTGTGL